jgi:hypothetical protein
MAIERVVDSVVLQCLSGDDISGTDYAPGTTMHVVDTGEQLVFANGQWTEDLRNKKE